MRARFGLCAFAMALSARSAFAQTNLPPPPPPPIDSTGGSSSSGSSGSVDNTPASSSSQAHKPKPKKTSEPARVATPPPAPPQHHEAEPPRAFERETPRTTSLRFNPLPLFAGRLSVDLEFLLAPHSAIVVSPNVTFHKLAFARNGNELGYGLGYAGDNSAGFGGEVGYHYWIRRHLDGVYVGPSLVLGATLPPAPTKTFAYYGAALDVGYQFLFSNGFTLNGGGGILIINASPTGSTVHAAPRFLFGIGWSF
jgi:hypothetical protein